MNNLGTIHFDLPEIQISFAYALKEIRTRYLQEALSNTVAQFKVSDIDAELNKFANPDSTSILAAHGMRGELLFAVPCLLARNPYLLAYYRLLLGYSQKGFYTSTSGAGVFKSMEEKGHLSKTQSDLLPDLCLELNCNADYMLTHFTEDFISKNFFDQLTLLTLGPQLRGGANVRKGTSSINDVFQIVYQIVEKSAISSSSRCIELKNSSGRKILIQFAADPDIVIREELAPDIYKNLVAIEVKGGQDYSNIHNRIGEAEKSHQKAKKDGYVECWTVVNVDRIDMKMASRESPTTNKFYRISELLNIKSSEYIDFKMQIVSIVGIR